MDFRFVRQDLQDYQDFFAFPEKRQKPQSLSEGTAILEHGES
jgi:hypothetical protein